MNDLFNMAGMDLPQYLGQTAENGELGSANPTDTETGD